MVKSVLFVCNLNSIRSPMAAALMQERARAQINVDSAGVHEGGLDPFVESVMDEVGISVSSHLPKSLSHVDLSDIDLVIALTPEAVSEARVLMPREKIEYWETENPAGLTDNRDEILEAYRRVRDELSKKITARFPELQETS